MAAMKGMDPLRDCRGFTLMEAVVSALIVSVALGLAAGLLTASQERMALSSLQALDPLPSLASRQLRADIKASQSVRGGEALWSREIMRLRGHPAGRVEYFLEAGDLRRRLTPTDGEPEVRTVLREVSTWRWRQPRPGLELVELELGYRWTERLRPGSRSSGESLPLQSEKRHLLVVSPRGGREGW